jgi:Flp pilus assembly protein TadG
VSARRSPFRPWLADRSGAAALEFAFALPVLVLMLAGLAQFCWAQHCASSMRYAMTQASRALMLNPTMTESAFTALVKSKLTSADGNVSISLAITTSNGLKVATATGVYTPTFALIFGSALPIRYSAKVVTSMPSS